MARLKVDVIVAANRRSCAAGYEDDSYCDDTGGSQDPVRRGFAASLARPGGSITGFWPQTPEVVAKRLQLLQEAIPKVSQMAVLWDPAFAGIQEIVRETEVAAKALGMQVQLVEARSPNEFETAFAAMTRQGAQAIFLPGSSMHYVHRARIAELAAKNHLAMGCFLREFAEAGCLMSYAPSIRDLWRRSATYVDKILKGAKPGDLPMEQPTKCELVINRASRES